MLSNMLYLVMPLLMIYIIPPAASTPDPHVRSWLLVLLMLVTPLVIHALTRLAFLAHARWPCFSRPGVFKALSFFLMALFFVQIHFLAWPDYLQDLLGNHFYILSDMALLFPYIICFLYLKFRLSLLWGGQYPIARSEVSTNLRLVLIVLLPQLIYLNLVSLIMNSPQLGSLLQSNPVMQFVLAAFLMLALFSVAPLFIRRIFPSQNLKNLPHAAHLESRFRAFAQAMGIKLRGVFVWDTGAQRIANAATSGILPSFRSFFITDYLLECLSDEELEAVFGHELAHAWLNHMFYYFFLALSSAVFITWGMLALSSLLPDISSGDLKAGLFVLLLLVFYLTVIFSFFARRFEFQADMTALHITGQGPEHLSHALMRIGMINRSSIKKTGLTHPSIEQRMQKLKTNLAIMDAKAWVARFRFQNRLMAGAVILINAISLLLVELLSKGVN